MSIITEIDLKFKSGNDVQVQDVRLTREEWAQVKALLPDENGFVRVSICKTDDVVALGSFAFDPEPYPEIVHQHPIHKTSEYQPSPGWFSENDPFGNVLAWDGKWHLKNWRYVKSDSKFTHWTRTGVIMPDPPGWTY